MNTSFLVFFISTSKATSFLRNVTPVHERRSHSVSFPLSAKTNVRISHLSNSWGCLPGWANIVFTASPPPPPPPLNPGQFSRGERKHHGESTEKYAGLPKSRDRTGICGKTALVANGVSVFLRGKPWSLFIQIKAIKHERWVRSCFESHSCH